MERDEWEIENREELEEEFHALHPKLSLDGLEWLRFVEQKWQEEYSCYCDYEYEMRRDMEFE